MNIKDKLKIQLINPNKSKLSYKKILNRLLNKNNRWNSS